LQKKRSSAKDISIYQAKGNLQYDFRRLQVFSLSEEPNAKRRDSREIWPIVACPRSSGGPQALHVLFARHLR
jgi:hypothetical protein